MGQISCRLASSVHFLPVAAGLLESSTLFVSVICISMHQEFWYHGSSLIPCEGSGYISVIACPLTFHLLHNFTWILLIHMEMMLFFKHFLFVKGSWNNFYCKTYFEEQNIIPICSCFYLTAWHLYGWLPLVLNVNLLFLERNTHFSDWGRVYTVIKCWSTLLLKNVDSFELDHFIF